MQTFLSTRLKMPKPRAGVVVRRALFETLEGIYTHKVTCLQAGAGIGKTTLLTSFFQKQKEMPYWFTVDALCDDIAIFWSYLFHTLPIQSEALITCFHQALSKEDVFRILDQALNQIEEEMVLVLDNCDDIQDKMLLESLSYFIRHAPDHFHIILVSRGEMHLSLYNEMLNGQLLMIEKDMLAFTQEESMQFLTQTIGIKENDKIIMQLCHKANGWVSALQFLAIGQKKDTKDTISTTSILRDYIQHEIFAYLSNEEKHFFIETSILSSFDMDFCKSYLELEHPKQYIQKIMAQNFIVTILDEEKELLCYHDIIKDFLMERFEQQEKSIIKQYRKRAADICYQRGEIQESLRHLFAIKDFHTAMNIITITPQDSEILYYLRKIPLDVICDNRDFAYQYYFYFYGNYEEAYCRDIYHVIHKELGDDPSFVAFENSMAIVQEPYLGNVTSILSIEELKTFNLKKETLSFTLLKDAYLLLNCGHYQEGLQRLDTVKEIYQDTHNLYTGSMLYMEYAQIYEVYGDFNSALQAYQEMKYFLNHLRLHNRSYQVGLAGVYIKQMRLQEADKLLDACQGSSEETLDGVDWAGIHTRIQWFCAAQQYAEAAKLLDKIQHSRIYHNLEFQYGLLKLYYIHDKSYPIIKEVKQKMKPIENISTMNADACILKTLLLESDQNMKEAMAIIEELQKVARKEGSRYVLVEADVTKLRLLWSQNSDDVNLQINILLEAISVATIQEIRLPFQMIRGKTASFWNMNQNEVLLRLSKKERTFLESLDIFSKDKDILTEREIEVLKEIAKGKSNKDIAKYLCIGIATVKTHIINIYSKLGVGSRVEAGQYYMEHYEKS